MEIGYLVLVVCAILIAPTFGIESIIGSREPCSNEGEEVTDLKIKDVDCFKCICQNGFVECESESCPKVDDCYLLMRRTPGQCCDKCKECVHNGKVYASGAEWSDPEDPCAAFKCVAGVVTESNLQCYTPCNDPRPPKDGECCPTCMGCYINGQKALEGREVTLSEDPCLKCQCSNKRLTCVKKACPVLQCAASKQIKKPGECCPTCTGNREMMQLAGKCILGKGFHSNGAHYNPDHCSSCECRNGTSICQRNTCPVLECPVDLQTIKFGECCPECPPMLEARSTCTYEERNYATNQTWELGPCRSCKCSGGVIQCAQQRCDANLKCRPNESMVTLPGQCCPQCVESDGFCTVFGDPHYKTFDGKFYNFQGSCKYLLTSDCAHQTFSIRVTNDGRNTKFASWTKTVTLKLGAIKVNLGQKMRIKVDGKKIHLPFVKDERIKIRKNEEDLIMVETDIGVKIMWDGNSYLQVQVPGKYKNKLCGLCGNFNGISRDDFITRRGFNVTEKEIVKFANSWRVGGLKACTRPKENQQKKRPCGQKKSMINCRRLKSPDVFGACDTRLNPQNYFDACRTDMCECPNGRCYCDSFAAYARECQRLGVVLKTDWRRDTNCLRRSSSSDSFSNVISQSVYTSSTPHPRHRNRTRKFQNQISQQLPKTIRRNHSGRTPPPLH